MKNDIVDKSFKLEEKIKKQFKDNIKCSVCGRIGGLKYKCSDGSVVGITLKKIDIYGVIKYVCQLCS